MEDQHDVVSHAFLSNQDFLLTINNKVATLIVATLSCILNNLIFTQLRQMTEARADHDWDFADRHFVLLENRRL